MKKPSRPERRGVPSGSWQGSVRTVPAGVMRLGEAADLGRRDRHERRAGGGRGRGRAAPRPPPARASRCSRRACRRASSMAAARSIMRAWSAASAAMSSGAFSQAMSGWRRMVPVAVQGASRRTASKGSGGRQSRMSAATVSASSCRRARLAESRFEPVGGDVDRRHPGAGGGELRGLAAGRGAEIGDALAGDVAEQARRERGGGVLHPPGAVVDSRAAPRSARRGTRRTEPVGSTMPPSFSAQACGIAPHAQSRGAARRDAPRRWPRAVASP